MDGTREVDGRWLITLLLYVLSVALCAKQPMGDGIVKNVTSTPLSLPLQPQGLLVTP